MTPSRKQPDSLRNLLEEAETELSRRLHEACEAEERGVSNESAEEIRRLEDSLLAAALAAERVVGARRHMRRDSAETEEAPNATVPSADTEPSVKSHEAPEAGATGDRPAPVGTTVREFEDNAGRGWRAWPVTPGLASNRKGSSRILGDFQEGWICFEALDNSARRRLQCREPRWSDLPLDELKQLLDKAIDARERKRRPSNSPGNPGGSDVH